MMVRLNRDQNGRIGGLTVTRSDKRRLYLFIGRTTALKRVTPKSRRPVRIYLKRWQAEVCVGKTVLYFGVLPLGPLYA
jgi:hypothetical protein